MNREWGQWRLADHNPDYARSNALCGPVKGPAYRVYSRTSEKTQRRVPAHARVGRVDNKDVRSTSLRIGGRDVLRTSYLPEHVRRFGPAILFATEGFESFNAVIRSRSIHSNRQAPSRDIARGFARVNRIRHLLSGGFFFRRDPSSHQDHNHSPRHFSRSEPLA